MDTVRSLGRQEAQNTAEVIVVNNGFPEERAAALEKHAAECGWTAPFRVVPEPIPGLGYSRKRGFLEAKGDWFVLLDDDNTVDPDFLMRLNEKIEAHPGLGGITAMVSPVWEEQPPEWLVQFGAHCLSYNEPSTFQHRPLEQFFPSGTAARAHRPPGGGMIIHRSVAESYLKTSDNPLHLALERTGDSLVGCQDQEIWLNIHTIGRGVLMTDALKVRHHIPKSRLARKYLLRLNYQMAYSYRVLDRLLAPSNPRPFLADFGHRLLQSARHLKIGLTKGPLFLHLIEIARDFGNFSGGRKHLPSRPSSNP